MDRPRRAGTSTVRDADPGQRSVGTVAASDAGPESGRPGVGSGHSDVAPGTRGGLAARFREREPGAFDAAHDRYRGPMYGVALSVLGDRTLAAECVQDAFVKAWRAADRVDPARDLGPWLTTITRRAAIDVHRRERRHRHPGEPTEDAAVTAPPSLVRTWEASEVQRAVDSLGPDEQAVVRLTDLHGFTHQEAASRLGIPVGTVKSRSHRARRRLAGLLAHVVVLALVVALGTGVLRDGGGSDPATAVVALAGTDLASGGSGHLTVRPTPDGVALTLRDVELPPAPTGTYYQAWVRGARGAVTVGTFHLREGDGPIELWAGVDIVDYPIFTVTLQEEGAGAASSGRVVLRGDLG